MNSGDLCRDATKPKWFAFVQKGQMKEMPRETEIISSTYHSLLMWDLPRVNADFKHSLI